MKAKAKTAEETVHGKTMQTLTPSGRVFKIREQNGNDDDILSNPSAMEDLSNIDNFLVSIIINEMDVVSGKTKLVTLEDVINLLNQDRYHLLITSRIFSLGPIMKFTYAFNENDEFNYEEDLSQYVHDYSKEFPNKGDEGYFKFKIPPYPADTNANLRIEVPLRSGKKVRFGFLTRRTEKYILALPADQRTKNAELKARQLEYQMENTEWIKVENFSLFSKMDMVEIQAAVKEVDQPYTFITELEHPRTKEVVFYPLMYSSSFFFPVEV